MQFNITFKTIFEYVLKKLVLCIQIRFVSTEKTTRIASRASCFIVNYETNMTVEQNCNRMFDIFSNMYYSIPRCRWFYFINLPM